MKALHIIVALGALLVSASALAQECYRAEECPGAATCENLVCTPADGLLACVGVDACGYGELCHDGFCKPDGVTCSSDNGSGVVRADSGEVNCNSGEGMGWSSGSAGVPDPGVDPIVPVVTPDAELYEMCTDELANCQPAPVPADECTADDLAFCTNAVHAMQAIEANCAPLWETAVSSDMAAPAPGGDALPPETSDPALVMVPVAPPPAEANPWQVVGCCDSLALEREEKWTDFSEFINCMSAVAATDCDAAILCEADLWGEPIGILEEGMINYTDAAGASDGESDEQAVGRDVSADDTTDDGGCSVANAGGTATTLFQLLF